MFKVVTEIGGNGTCAGIKALNDRLKIASKVSHMRSPISNGE